MIGFFSSKKVFNFNMFICNQQLTLPLHWSPQPYHPLLVFCINVMLEDIMGPLRVHKFFYTFNEEGLLRWHPTCPFCTGESCMFRQECNCFPLTCYHVSFLHWLRPHETSVELTFHYYHAKRRLSALYRCSHPRVYFLEMNAYIKMVDEAYIPILCTFDSRRQPFTWQVGHLIEQVAQNKWLNQPSWCEEKEKQ